MPTKIENKCLVSKLADLMQKIKSCNKFSKLGFVAGVGVNHDLTAELVGKVLQLKVVDIIDIAIFAKKQILIVSGDEKALDVYKKGGYIVMHTGNITKEK